MRLIYTAIICFLLCISFNASAQSSAPINTLDALKDGVLIVRITTNKKKIDYFEKVLSDRNLDKKARGRFQKLKADAIELRNINLVNIITGFENNYTYSQYRFVYDTDIKKISKGTIKGVFINPETYEIDEQINLPTGKPIFYLRAGDYKYDPHPYFITGVITNQDFIDLSGRAFKAKVKFRERFETFTKKEIEVLPMRAQQVPEILNNKLWLYYKKQA